jgi:hypothetical protein
VGVRGVWKVRVRAVVSSKGPEWTGIHHHEQDIGLPSKWVFFFYSTRDYAWILIICVVV